MIEFIKYIATTYKKPLIVLTINFLVYAKFGVTNECGMRCPMPPMNSFQHFLFDISFIIIIICFFWIKFIFYSEKDKNK